LKRRIAMHAERVVKRGAVLVLIGWPVFLAAWAGCAKESSVEASSGDASPRHLTVITPHNAPIREAIESGFSDWYRAKQDRHVNIDWIVRGTPRCLEYVEKVFTAPGETARQKRPDLMFGGGIADHKILADRGWCRPLALEDDLAGIPSEVQGLPTRDPEGRWFATDLSSFGIVYHDELCRQRGIAPPLTWQDLAEPRFRSWVGVADPTASGSHAQCFMLILQKDGWDKGWATIIRVLANARALVGGSSDALHQVESGVFLAGFAVSFDGLALMDKTGGAVKYVSPGKATAITPGVTSVLRTAADVSLAEDFVRYCLSEPC